MNIEKTKKKLEELRLQDRNAIEEARAKISDLESQLKTVNEEIDKTYRSGDVVTGEKLSGDKAVIECRIKYFNEYIRKKESLPLVNDDEAKSIKNDLNNEIRKKAAADKKRFDSMVEELKAMADSGLEAIREIRDCGNEVISLQKKDREWFGINDHIVGFYVKIDKFVSNYIPAGEHYLSEALSEK